MFLSLTAAANHLTLRGTKNFRARPVILTFRDKELEALCNSHESLAEEFGEYADVVARRLIVLDRARRLGDITTLPPDRRRQEKTMGNRHYSVCARAAGRVYFEAESEAEVEEIDTVEITMIGWRA
jgi:plasmid maintenance system killer protein